MSTVQQTADIMIIHDDDEKRKCGAPNGHPFLRVVFANKVRVDMSLEIAESLGIFSRAAYAQAGIPVPVKGNLTEH